MSTLINHFMISKPREERLNEVTWTVYAIFKCAGRVSRTLEMQCGQVKISRKLYSAAFRLTPRLLRAFGLLYQNLSTT